MKNSIVFHQNLGKAFRLKDQSKIKAYGYPRCDLFFLDKNGLDKHIQKYESKLVNIITELKGFEKTYIYMPTWRDYDFFEESKFNFIKLNSTLQELNSCFLLKLHPATKINLSEKAKLRNIKLFDNDIDIYPLLPYTDCLITDYSSVSFDAFYRGSNIVFWWKEHDYCLNLYKNTLMLNNKNIFGDIAMSNAALNDTVIKNQNDMQDPNYINRYRKIVEFHDDNNTQRI